MVLEEYATMIGSAAGVAGFALIFSPAFICKTIIKRGTTKDIPIGNFIECISRNVMNLQQGLLISAWPLIAYNFLGVILNFVYISIYVLYTQDRRRLKKVLVFFGLLLMAVVVYVRLEDSSLIEWRFGILNTVFNIFLLCFHTYRLKVVVQSKSTKNLPFPILVAAFFVTFLWFLYGVALYKPMLMISAGIALLICIISLSMFVIYPSTDDKVADKKKSS